MHNGDTKLIIKRKGIQLVDASFLPLDAWRRVTLQRDAMRAGTSHYPYTSSSHDLLSACKYTNFFISTQTFPAFSAHGIKKSVKNRRNVITSMSKMQAKECQIKSRCGTAARCHQAIRSFAKDGSVNPRGQYKCGPLGLVERDKPSIV